MLFVLVLIGFLTNANALSADALALHQINIHECTPKGQDEIVCDWRGPGMYIPDRPLVQIRTLTFLRFFAKGFLNLEGPFATDVNIVQIQNGDVSCKDIRTARGKDVVVLINDLRCSDEPPSSHAPVDGSSTSSLSSESPKMPNSESTDLVDMISDTSTYPEKTTAVKMNVRTTQDGQMPLINLTWQSTTEIKVLLIILTTLIMTILFGIGLWHLYKKKIIQPTKNRNNSNSDIEIFSMSTRPSRSTEIPTYSFSDFINDTHLKEKDN